MAGLLQVRKSMVTDHRAASRSSSSWKNKRKNSGGGRQAAGGVRVIGANVTWLFGVFGETRAYSNILCLMSLGHC